MNAGDGSLRVAIDARFVDGASGGVQQWVISLADAIGRLTDGDEDYLFLVNEGHDAWIRPYLRGRSGVIVQPAPPPGAPKPPGGAAGLRRRAARALPMLRRAYRAVVARAGQAAGPAAVARSAGDRTIRAHAVDVMHFTRQQAFATSVPSIFQPWDLQHLHLPEFFTAAEIERREREYRAFCEQAALIVVATTWVRDDIVAQYGIEPARIAVVNPPPVTNAYVPPTEAESQAIAARLGLPDRYVVYPAKTWAHKNHERLFQAIALLRARGHAVPLVLSGGSTDRQPALERLARDLGIADLLHHVGFVTPAEIQVLYRRATALVFPSLYEGWGLPIVEAFASDMPVVTSRATSLPRLVGDAALTFDALDPASIADAIEQAWTDAKLRTELVAMGRRRLAEFDWSKTARHMRALYRHVAGRRLEPEDLALIAAPPLV